MEMWSERRFIFYMHQNAMEDVYMFGGWVWGKGGGRFMTWTLKK